MLAAELQHLGVNETLDQPEDVGVRTALYLADETPFIFGQRGELLRQRQSVGQKLLRATEPAASNYVLVNVPAHALGRPDTTGVAIAGDGFHRPMHVDLLHCGAYELRRAPALSAIDEYRGAVRCSMIEPPEDMTGTPDPL